MADPRSVSVVIPACNEAAAIGDVVRELSGVAPWCEILVIDDGSSDDTGARAAAAGGRVVRHPYTKGNGATPESSRTTSPIAAASLQAGITTDTLRGSAT